MNNNKCNFILQNVFFSKIILKRIIDSDKKKEIPFIWEQVLVYKPQYCKRKIFKLDSTNTQTRMKLCLNFN